MPNPDSSNEERRRRVRQKLYTPVYASFNGPQTGMVVDLSELLDLHEEGFAVQTSERLEINRAVTLCLDLPETRNFIHGCGEVMWSDDTGRGGIRFSALSESSRQILKEWLFSNLLIGCSNFVARAGQRAQRDEEKSPGPVLVSETPGRASNVIPISTRSETASTETISNSSSNVETGLAPSSPPQAASPDLEALRQAAIQPNDDADSDTVFQRITDRALILTGATGAALAFLTGDEMICRAQAGEPSPPLGAAIDAKQGLSGECIRTGLPVSCEDLQNDPRVDPEIGRALGIGSLMAVPIFSDFRVVGLLEVFSPLPQSFTTLHRTLLHRLVEIIPQMPSPRVHHPEKTKEEIETKATPPETPPEPEDVFTWHESVTPDQSVETGLDPFPAVEINVVETNAIETNAVEINAVEINNEDFDFLHEIREPLWEPDAPEQRAEHAPEHPLKNSSSVSGHRFSDSKNPARSNAPLGAADRMSISASGVAPTEPAYPPPEKIVTEQAPQQVPESPSPSTSRWPHTVLLGLVFAVVAIAVGYLFGSIIEKRWANSPRQQVAEAASTQSATNQRPVNQPAQDVSLADLRNLADHGDAEAQWQLGLRYHNGEGVPLSDTQAVLWYELAAEQGNVSAQAALGAYYWAGRGIPKDLTKAYMWSAIALAGGDEDSKSRLQGLTYEMTKKQLSEARQQAEEWIHSHSQRAKTESN